MFERKISRRGFIKGIAGIAAAGVVLPDDEVVRRFWRGWSPRAAAASNLDDAFAREYMRQKFAWEQAILYGQPRPFQAFDVLRVDHEIMWWDGQRMHRGQAGTDPVPHATYAKIDILGVIHPDNRSWGINHDR